MSEVIERYKNWGGLRYKRGTSQGTIKGYAKDLLLMCLYLRNPPIEKVIEPQITGYFSDMLELGWSPNGLMCKSIAARNLFKYAKKIGLDVLDHELIQIIQREIKIPRAAEDWEIERLLETCIKDSKLQRSRNRLIINFLRSTGCRVGEMCSINVPQIMETMSERRVLIKTAKSRGIKPIRELFWDEETHSALDDWINVREEFMNKSVGKDMDALFVGVRGWQTGKRITNSGVGIMFRNLSKRAGLETVNAHSFRHHRGNEMNEENANNSTISSVLGHSSLASSYIYTQRKSPSLKRAAQHFRQGAHDDNQVIKMSDVHRIVAEMLANQSGKIVRYDE